MRLITYLEAGNLGAVNHQMREALRQNYRLYLDWRDVTRISVNSMFRVWDGVYEKYDPTYIESRIIMKHCSPAVAEVYTFCLPYLCQARFHANWDWIITNQREIDLTSRRQALANLIITPIEASPYGQVHHAAL